MTLRPEELSEKDAAAVFAAGVSESALLDAVHVCAAFNVINRVADGLDFAMPDARDHRSRS